MSQNSPFSRKKRSLSKATSDLDAADPAELNDEHAYFPDDAALEAVGDRVLTVGQLEAEDRHDRHIAGRDLDEALPAFTPPAVEPTPEDVAAYNR